MRNMPYDPGTDKAAQARAYYYKLHDCLRQAMSNGSYSCHVNCIVVELGKSIESQETYYNPMFDMA